MQPSILGREEASKKNLWVAPRFFLKEQHAWKHWCGGKSLSAYHLFIVIFLAAKLNEESTLKWKLIHELESNWEIFEVIIQGPRWDLLMKKPSVESLGTLYLQYTLKEPFLSLRMNTTVNNSVLTFVFVYKYRFNSDAIGRKTFLW